MMQAYALEVLFQDGRRTFDICTSSFPSWTSIKTTRKTNAETKEKIKKGVGKRDFSKKASAGRLSVSELQLGDIEFYFS